MLCKDSILYEMSHTRFHTFGKKKKVKFYQSPFKNRMLPGNVQMVYCSKDGRTFQNWYASVPMIALHCKLESRIT